MAMNGIQSLDRGLEILKLLSESGRLTASHVAEKLGIHQSSASRLLLSLHKAGLVRKPDFHSFEPDFGLLAFAGTAMSNFPEVKVCTEICGRLARENDCGAAAVTLFQGRLIYLAKVDPSPLHSLHLVDDSRFPFHRSSAGLLLAYRLGREAMLSLLALKLKESSEKPESLYEMVKDSVETKGLLDLRDVPPNRFNFSLDFECKTGRLAYALFSERGEMTVEQAKAILEKAIEKSRKLLKG